tara:strand:- start:2070 stop:2267 length:198 start_codon:yes stop_codon:yes gene_type:complete
MKKRKLNSTNPKYKKTKAEDEAYTKKLIGDVNGVKIYTLVSKKSITPNPVNRLSFISEHRIPEKS